MEKAVLARFGSHFGLTEVNNYLEQGWKVKSVTPANHGNSEYVIFVLYEDNNDEKS